MSSIRNAIIVTTKETSQKVSPLVRILEAASWFVSVACELPTASEIRDRKVRLLISHHNGNLLDQSHIDAVEGRCFNIHPSVIPLNRGANPIMWATLRSSIYGITVHQVNTGIDKGPPIWQQVLEIDEYLTLNEIYQLHEHAWYSALEQLTTQERWLEDIDSISLCPLVRGSGTFHSRQQSAIAFRTFEQGWNTVAWEAKEQYHMRFGLTM